MIPQKTIEHDPTRTYQLHYDDLCRCIVGGRETTGYTKGKRVLKPLDVNVGDLLIVDSHAFQATNIVVVAPRPAGFMGDDYPHKKFYVMYRDSEGDVTTGLQCVWEGPELTGESASYYHAVRVKKPSVKKPKENNNAAH